MTTQINSLAPGRFERKFRSHFKILLMAGGWDISCEIAHKWMSLDTTVDKSTLVQVITWTNVDPDLCRHMASLGHNELMMLHGICRALVHWWSGSAECQPFLCSYHCNVLVWRQATALWNTLFQCCHICNILFKVQTTFVLQWRVGCPY